MPALHLRTVHLLVQLVQLVHPRCDTSPQQGPQLLLLLLPFHGAPEPLIRQSCWTEGPLLLQRTLLLLVMLLLQTVRLLMVTLVAVLQTIRLMLLVTLVLLQTTLLLLVTLLVLR